MRLTYLLAIAALFCGCTSTSGGSTGGDSPVPAGEKICADGFDPLEGGMGCTAILPKAACAAGTRAAIGAAECVPVGHTACAAGFERDPSGWGCTPVLASGCTGATREKIGSATCVPVSDCNAAFPPTSATIFVSAAYTDAQIDATHFKSIGAAVAAAQKGAVIAVDSGAYTEKMTVTKDDVQVVGRCADKVVVTQVDGVVGSAVEVGVQTGIGVSNMTFRGFNGAISVLGGKATLRSLVIEDSLLAGVVAANSRTEVRMSNVVVRNTKVRSGQDQAFGLFASKGAQVVVEDSVFSGNEFAGIGTTGTVTAVHLSRSIVRDSKTFGASKSIGLGVYVAEGAALDVAESAILDNHAAGVNIYGADDPATSGVIKKSVIRGTKLDGVKNARGIEVTAGKLTVEDTTIAENAQLEMIISSKARADLKNVTLRGKPQSGPDDRGALGLVTDESTTKANGVAIVWPRAGVEVMAEGTLDMQGSLVFGTRAAPVMYEDFHWLGVGFMVESKATLTLGGSTIQDAHVAGILTTGHVTVNDTLVRGTRANGKGEYGRGVSIQNGGVGEIARSAFVDNEECGVLSMLDGASVTLNDSTIESTVLDRDGRFGMGILVGGDATAAVDRCTITSSAGVGLAVSSAGASVRRTTFSRNTVAVHAQDGTAMREGDADAVDPRALLISSDTRFIGNTTRTGSGFVVVPPVLETPRAIQR